MSGALDDVVLERAETEEPAPPATRPRKRFAVERYATLLFFALVFLVIGILKGSTYISLDNLLLVLGQNSHLAFVSGAVTLTLIAGQFDLSVGALLGLAAILVTGLTAHQHIPVIPAAALVVIAGVVAGTLNGLLVTVFDVNAFIATLGTGSAFGGFALLYTGGQTIYSGIPHSLTSAGTGTVVGIPLPFIYALALLGLLWVLTLHTVIGRYWYALGSNTEAARIAGVPIFRSTMAAFVATGVVAALGGLVLAARFGSAEPTTGGELVLPAFAAAFLGSSILSDGRFRILGSVLATFLIAFATNGMQILGIGSFIEPIFNGAVLVFAVAITSQLRRRQLTLGSGEREPVIEQVNA